MKISLLQAQIIKYLDGQPKPDRTAVNISKDKEISLDYVYRQLQQLKIYNYITVINRGRRNHYNPTEEGKNAANERISAEIEKKLIENGENLQKSEEKQADFER